MMLWGAIDGSLELREAGGETRLTARFPYGRETEIAAGRFEVIAPRAFAARLDAGDEIHLLAGHDFNHPLASRQAGTLTLTDSDDALIIDASIQGGTTWARDFIAANRAGLIRGLSPGFRVPQDGERVEHRSGRILRTITAADLFEVSAVTRPAYPDAQIEARNWAGAAHPAHAPAHPLNRWRL